MTRSTCFFRLMLVAVTLALSVTLVRAADESAISQTSVVSEEGGDRVMNQELEGLRWHPSWTSHMGCIKGCTDWLVEQGKMSEPLSRAWIWGGTGHAFVINISKDACPSGPTAWNTERIAANGANLGYRVEGVFGSTSTPDFAEKQKAAIDHVRQSIDDGIPCYSWELEIPEYYVIYGYDDAGFYYNGPTAPNGAGPKLWSEFGDVGTGALEVYSVHPAEAKSDCEIIRAALQFAIEHASDNTPWSFPNYSTGVKAFEIWADAVDAGIANRHGQGYNAEVWLECRSEAVNFLEEVKERISGGVEFDNAIEKYSAVRDLLKQVRDRYPMPRQGESMEPVSCPETAELLRQAANAEREALESLRGILASL